MAINQLTKHQASTPIQHGGGRYYDLESPQLHVRIPHNGLHFLERELLKEVSLLLHTAGLQELLQQVWINGSCKWNGATLVAILLEPPTVTQTSSYQVSMAVPVMLGFY